MTNEPMIPLSCPYCKFDFKTLFLFEPKLAFYLTLNPVIMIKKEKCPQCKNLLEMKWKLESVMP